MTSNLCATILVALMSPALADETKVLNADAWFPEGPIWYQNKLFYVEYGRNTVMTWDGTKIPFSGNKMVAGHLLSYLMPWASLM